MTVTITKFWKSLLTIVLFWVFYAFFGFEVTVVTLLAGILGNFWGNSDILVLKPCFLSYLPVINGKKDKFW